MVLSKNQKTSMTQQSLTLPTIPSVAMTSDQKRIKLLRAVFARRTEEKQIFFKELNQFRRKKDQTRIKNFFKLVGPKWYQVLSEQQRQSLNKLESSIYQDLLEGRPTRVTKVLKDLGIYRLPSCKNLLTCAYLGRKDPKQFFAQLFYIIYGHTVDLERTKYSLNAKLILSSIFYLGQSSLIDSLSEMFHIEKKAPAPPPKPKPRPKTSSISPYIDDLVVLKQPKQIKTKQYTKLVLPDFEKLEEAAQRSWIPPPPSPRHSSFQLNTDASHLIPRHLQIQKYTPNKRRRIKPPKAEQWNEQNIISGVYTVHGKRVFVLDNVTILPPLGNVIHGGLVHLKGEMVNINDGIYATAMSLPSGLSETCDCIEKWQKPVFDYLNSSKCNCDHYYDFGNKGEYPSDELTFFHKPTRYSPPRFDYANIFELNEQTINVCRKFKNVWETDSVLGADGAIDRKEKKRHINPRPEDYLKIALKALTSVNLSASLPNVYETPELKAWLRRRMNGPLTAAKKQKLVHRCRAFASRFHAIFSKRGGHVSPGNHPILEKPTTWAKKDKLNQTLHRITGEYKFNVFKAQARMANLFWPIMFQSDMPNKRFREIFFAYLPSRVSDLTIMRPYNAAGASERAMRMRRKPYRCRVTGHY